jgi:hypothetical protein
LGGFRHLLFAFDVHLRFDRLNFREVGEGYRAGRNGNRSRFGFRTGRGERHRF